MDTHDEGNKAGPQKESSSVFRGGPISQGDTQADSQINNRQASNPYRLEQSSREDNTKESLEDSAKESREDNTQEQFGATPPSVRGADLWQQIKDKLFPEKPGVNNIKQKAMVILIPILAIVMIFMFRQVLSKAPKKTRGATNDDAPAVGTVGSDSEINWQIPEPIPMEIRDPIKPATQAQTVLPSAWQTDSNDMGMLSVRGILYSQDKPSAVIGNRIVHLNDKIDGATVVEIDRDSVIFERNGKRWTKKVAELEIEQKEQEQIELNDETDKIQS